jgi:ferritin-like metal-binding protein YciE
MPREGLNELYIDELKNLYNAENQLINAIVKMAKAASSEELKYCFDEHLEQTRRHIERLDEIFTSLDESPTGKKSAGMAGLIREGREVMGQDLAGAVMDAALIGTTQLITHYEIAAYRTVCEFAQLLGASTQASLLQQILLDKKEANDRLTRLAKIINFEANVEIGIAEQEARTQGKPPRRVA